MTGSAFLDTNVLVYAFDDDEPHKQAQARGLLDSPPMDSLVVSTQVLAEFYVTVTRKLARPVAPVIAQQAVAALRELPVIGMDADFVVAGIELSDRHQLSLWDGLIVQAAIAGGCDTLLTEDLADGSVLDGVRIQNPFAPAT